MDTEDKIVSLNDFKENRKLVHSDGTLYTGFYTDYYDLVNDQQGYFEEYYKDGKLNGLSTWWYENGQKECENHYKDGKLNGLSTWWYENGQKEYEIHYKDGKLNGLSTWWYENGQIECEGFFKDGIEVDDPESELDENELPFSSNGPVAFINNFCLTFFYTLVGFKFSKYILDAWF